MTEQLEVTDFCTGCGIPAEEMPDSVASWVSQITQIDELTDPTCQGYIKCENTPECPGHLVERKLFCTSCQKEGKHDVQAHTRTDSRPDTPA